MPKTKTKFSDSWISNPEYNDWLSKKDEPTARFSYVDVSNMSRAALRKHKKSKIHSERSPQGSNLSSFPSFKQEETSNSSETSKSSKGSSSSLSKQDPCQSAIASKIAQGTLDTVVERENVLLAEIH